MKNGKKCKVCGASVTGKQRVYCSKTCREQAEKEDKKRYREENKEEIKEYKKIYYKNNREEILSNSKIYIEENKEKRKEYNRIYYKNNREEILEYGKKYNRENKEKIKEYKRKNKEKIRECGRKRKQDPVLRMNTNISRTMRRNLKSNNLSKNRRKWETLVGYTSQDLREHLESLFLPGMTWKNYGKNGWVMDHIIPKVFFIFTSTDDVEFRYCWSLDNLQPLWAPDNQEKNDKITLWGKIVNARNVNFYF